MKTITLPVADVMFLLDFAPAMKDIKDVPRFMSIVSAVHLAEANEVAVPFNPNPCDEIAMPSSPLTQSGLSINKWNDEWSKTAGFDISNEPSKTALTYKDIEKAAQYVKFYGTGAETLKEFLAKSKVPVKLVVDKGEVSQTAISGSSSTEWKGPFPTTTTKIKSGVDLHSYINTKLQTEVIGDVFESVSLSEFLTPMVVADFLPDSLTVFSGDLMLFPKGVLNQQTNLGNPSNKVEAIKAYRMLTKKGLKEAKNFIFEMAAENKGGVICKEELVGSTAFDYGVALSDLKKYFFVMTR